MDNTRTLSQPDQIKALANPLRQRILEQMIQEPITTKQVADRIGEKPTKLYHHVEALENAGLVRLVKTKRKRGAVEKYFQAVAQRFVVDRSAVEVTAEGDEAGNELESIISRSLEETLAEIRKGIASGLISTEDEAAESVFIRSHLRATPLQMSRLMQRLQEWVRECQVSHDPNADLEYGVTVVFYPTRTGR